MYPTTFHLHTSLTSFLGEVYRACPFDTIYFVASQTNIALNEEMASRLSVFQNTSRVHPDNWLPPTIKTIFPETNRFSTDKRAKLFCAMLPSVQTRDKGTTFLCADIDDCPPELLLPTLQCFWQCVLNRHVEVLDTLRLDVRSKDSDILIVPLADEIEGFRIPENVSPLSGFTPIARYARERKAPSRIEIQSSCYAILLPDYGGIELKMPAQSKALYILFLRHAEGFRMKEIYDYRCEYARLYRILSNRSDLHKLDCSAETLLNNLDHRTLKVVHANCKRAIENALPKKYIKPYQISGRRGEVRRVLIDRELVVLPKELNF